MKESEPDNIPENLISSSPAFNKFCKFSITGKPAPTLVSYRNLRLLFAASWRKRK